MWAVRLAATDAWALGRLRLAPGVEVCAAAGVLWLRGSDLSEHLAKQLLALPAAECFTVHKDGQLTPVGALTPRGYLPQGHWKPLSTSVSAEPPAAAWAGEKRRASLRIAPSSSPQKTNVLLTDLKTWRSYGASAPQVRLERWVFAVNERDQVAIWGEPVPPLPGRFFSECEGVAVQAGYAWTPPLEPAVVRRSLQLQPHDLALLAANGPLMRIAADQFVRATRSAIRLSGGGYER